MIELRFDRLRLGVLAAAFIFGGCGGTLAQSGASGSMSPAASQSSMAKAALGGDLLYLSVNGPGITNVYTYPAGKRVGSVTYPAPDYTPGLCSNSAGDVFIPTGYTIYEFPHGGASPVAMLSSGLGEPDGCSVDPTTGDLAATISSGFIEIYRSGPRYHWYLPREFRLRGIASGAYDARGNLFIDGSARNAKFFLVRLPKGGSKFENVTVSGAPSSAGYVQWDGHYLAIGSRQNLLISRFAISGTHGRRAGLVKLGGPSRVQQFWIEGATVIAVAFTSSRGWFAGFWRYPQGGFAYKAISASSSYYGVTVSTSPTGPAQPHVKL